jgi:hypothetical protein
MQIGLIWIESEPLIQGIVVEAIEYVHLVPGDTNFHVQSLSNRLKNETFLTPVEVKLTKLE